MCGICGIVGLGAASLKTPLINMVQALKHRGPDADGVLCTEHCLLGHTRLSIIDLCTGAQPMRYVEHGASLTVVLNGEIYNYRQLHEQQRLVCRTQSDTEVIPALYALHGESGLCESLVGMFAFALWDEAKQRLICGRDRFGEKPFYYAITEDNHFVFASEIQAIISSGLVRPTLSKRGVAQYLKLRYIPENSCIYDTIHVLEPGHFLTWETSKLTVEAYWSPPPTLQSPPKFQEAVEELRFLARQAVSRSMVSDVDVGILLSGGLDSSTLAALAAQEYPLQSFCFGFEGERDERPYAAEVARHYDLIHREQTDASMDLPFLLRKLCHVYGEPFADSSALPTWLLCGHVKKHVSVVLGGDGADELLGGYDYWYKPLLQCRNEAAAPQGYSEQMLLHWQDITYFSELELLELGLDDVLPPRMLAPSSTVDDAFRMDIAGFLPSDVLRKVDRAAMSHGLELRAPFLDVDLASFLIALPPEYKIANGSTKAILREAFSDLWPESVRNHGKQGFGYNVSLWLRRPELQLLRHYYLNNKHRKIYSLFPADVLRWYAADEGFKGWHMLVLAIWLEHSVWEMW